MKSRGSTEECSCIYGDRLDFVLKSFVRIAWTSAAAEQVWSPKLSRVISAITRCEWMSVVFKLRRCALFQLHDKEVERYLPSWVAQGLKWKFLSDNSPRTGTWWLGASLRRSVPSRVVVLGSNLDINDFERAWEDQDHESMGRLLGYPRCCRFFFEEVAVSQGCIDTVWAMSRDNQKLNVGECTRSVNGAAVSNILLQGLGIRAVPHSPCSFGCHATTLFAHDLRLVAGRIGLTTEYELLSDILSWPAEWSGLHGIAEVKTPIVKVCTPTDATGSRYTVRWNGSLMPKEGAHGLVFPFKTSCRVPSADALVWPTPSATVDSPEVGNAPLGPTPPTTAPADRTTLNRVQTHWLSEMDLLL